MIDSGLRSAAFSLCYFIALIGQEIEWHVKPLCQRYRALVWLWRDQCDPNAPAQVIVANPQ